MHKQKREKMNILKFSLSVSVLSFLLIACGGSDSGKSTSPIKAKTIEQAEKNLVALGYILSRVSKQYVEDSTKFGIHPTLKEERIIECDQGTLETSSKDKNSLTVIYRGCNYDGEYQDGTVMRKKVFVDSTRTVNKTTKYSNYTYKKGSSESYLDLIEEIHTIENYYEGAVTSFYSLDGVHSSTYAGEKDSVTYSNFIEKGTIRTSTFNGKLEFDTRCIKGTYMIETVEKVAFLYKSKGIDAIASGTLKLNGATYTYEEPYLIVEAGGKSKTYYQSNISKRMLSYQEANCSF